MRLDDIFLFNRSPEVLSGAYDPLLIALSLFVAILAGIMTFQLAGIARTESRHLNRQLSLLSGAFVLGSGVWSMHFIGMLAYSVCSSANYDPFITVLSMLPSFIASWIALALLTREKISGVRLVVSGISVGAGIGVMHYSGMAAVHKSLDLRFDPWVFVLSIGVAVALSILALWLRFQLIKKSHLNTRQIDDISGIFLGGAISGMHYTGMAAAHFLEVPGAPLEKVPNTLLAFGIAGITIFAILVTFGINALLRYRFIYQRMVQTEARTRTILETAVDGIITINSVGDIQAFNKAAEEIFGWTADEVLGKNIKLLMPEESRLEHDSYLQNYLKTGVAKIIGSGREVIGLRKNGMTFPLRLAIGKAALQDETLFVGFVSDISERRLMEKALRDSELQFRSLIGNLPGIAFRCHANIHRNVLFISDGVERLTGWSAMDFVLGEMSLEKLLHPDDLQWMNEKVVEVLNLGNSYTVEYRVIDRAGNHLWVSESASAVRGASGNIEWFDGVILDITGSKRRNAEFEGVVDAIGRSLAMVEFDLQGTILSANPNFLSITGYELEELVGHHHSVLCSPEEVATEAYLSLWNTLRAGKFASGEYLRIGKNGKQVWIHGSYNPILDPAGRPYKIIKFANDTSERHAMEQTLRDAKGKAEAAAAAKSTFLANMSHEIRTPMNSIIGFTELLLSAPADDLQRRHLTTVRNSARSLLLLLNDILDTAKLERGAVELEISDFSLREVCMQVLATLRINAQGKNLPLVLEYPDQTPDFYLGDALRVQQILLNLVGNAIKFTDKGNVTLNVRYENGQVHMVVIDTGIGIAPDRIAHIFDQFAQADASMSRRFGGTGLGTTIARQLIELMHGHIYVESTLGLGSRFHIVLPLEQGKAIQSTQEQAIVTLPPLEILVADDVPQNLELLEYLLKPLGHSLTTAVNGKKAVQAYIDEQFDILLMDVQMPVLNGLDACRQIRRIEMEMNRPRTPIIALTASVLSEDVNAAHQAGMDGFASKPVEMHALTREIARLLGVEVPAEQLPARLTVPLANGSVIDWVKGGNVWGSEQRHSEAIQRFLKDPVNNAVYLRQLLSTPLEMAAQAHRIKGAALNLALSRVASQCGHIETELASGVSGNVAALLDNLADELNNVHEAIGKYTAALDIASDVLDAPDQQRLQSVLQELETALARGELVDPLLASLSKLLSKSALETLDNAINAFDFDAAIAAASELKNHYCSKEPHGVSN